MKKILSFFLITVTILSMTSMVFALDDYGTVRDITKEAGDSLSSGEGTIETKGNTTTIKYSAATFKMLEEDRNADGGERPGPAAWIGFEITEPSSDNNSQFKVTTPDGKTTQMSASSFKDYVGITPSNLKKVLLNGTLLSYKYSFDWDEDGSNDQYVIIQIDPEGITLIPSNGKDNVWSPAIAQSILKEQNPNTSDISFFPIFGLLIVGVLGFTYCTKKA